MSQENVHQPVRCYAAAGTGTGQGWGGGDLLRQYRFDGKRRLTLSFDRAPMLTAVLKWKKVRRR